MTENANGFVWTRHHTIVLTILCLAQLLDALDVTVVNVALPAVERDLGFEADDLHWLVNAYTVLFGGFLLLGGRSADLLGARRVLLAGIGLFTAASLASGLAQSASFLVATRAAQGLAAAFIAPTTLALIATSFPQGPARNRALGIWGAVTGVSSSLGVMLGGVLTSGPGWRWIFFVNVPVGLLLLAVGPRVLAAPARRQSARGRVDVVGAGTSTAGLGLLAYGVAQTNVHGWQSTRTVALLLLAAGLLAYFLIHERWLAREPLVPLAIFRNRSVTAANVIAALVGAGLLAMFYFISLYQQQVLHLSAVEAGLSYLPLTAMLTAFAFLAPVLIPRIGVRYVLALGAAVASAGLLLLAQVDPDGGVWRDVVLPSLVVGPGLALTFIPVSIAAVSDVSPDQTGLASGLVTVTRTVGGALGLAAIATVAGRRTEDLRLAGRPAGSALTSGFTLGFTVSACLLAVAAVAALLLFRDRRGEPVPSASAAAAAPSAD